MTNFNYSKLITKYTIFHVEQSCIAARAEGNDYIAIDSDKCISLFTETLTSAEYTTFNWEKAEEFLFNYAKKTLAKTPVIN